MLHFDIFYLGYHSLTVEFEYFLLLFEIPLLLFNEPPCLLGSFACKDEMSVFCSPGYAV